MMMARPLLNTTATSPSSLSPPSSPSPAPLSSGSAVVATHLGGHEHVPLTSIPTLASALLADDAGSMHHVHSFLASLAVKASTAASLLSPFDQVPTWAATPQRRRRRRTNTADGEAGNHKTSKSSTKRKATDDGDDEAHPNTTATTSSSTTRQPRKHRRVKRDETQKSDNKPTTTARGRRRRSATTTAAVPESQRGSRATSIAFLLNDAGTDCALDDSTFLFDYAASPSPPSSRTPSPIEPAAPPQLSPLPPIRTALHAAPPGGFPFPCHFILG